MRSEGARFDEYRAGIPQAAAQFGITTGLPEAGAAAAAVADAAGASAVADGLRAIAQRLRGGGAAQPAPAPTPKAKPLLFVGLVGSGVQSSFEGGGAERELRDAARETWLRNMAPDTEYRFFVFQGDGAIAEEADAHGDLVAVERAAAASCSGAGMHVGDCKTGALGVRALQYAAGAGAAYALVLDPAGYLCVPSLAAELRGRRATEDAGTAPFVWSTWWCMPGLEEKPDQSFALVSERALGALVGNGTATSASTDFLAGYDTFIQLGDNLGHHLAGQEAGTWDVLDDRVRIESQQQWHTDHRFQTEPAGYDAELDFEHVCRDYIYVHVAPSRDARVVYTLGAMDSVSAEAAVAAADGRDVAGPRMPKVGTRNTVCGRGGG